MKDKKQDKAAFFAQYIGSKLGGRKSFTDSQELTISNFSSVVRFSSAPLELKPLSAITDEDALKLSQILHPCIELANVDHGKAIAESLTLFGVCTNQEIGARFAWSIQYISDFLRSRGYLIPFRNYSTGQILEMGWAKPIDL